MDLEQGKKLVGLARKAVKNYFQEKKPETRKEIRREFSAKRGVFVTILSWPGENLKGCIGFPLPTTVLYKAIEEAAVSAAVRDPRFAPLAEEELEKVVFEVSVLTEPEEIEVKEEKDLEQVRVGKDGLIVNYDDYAVGLLLPQVATEFKLDSKGFLEAACEKAGLDKNAWKEEKKLRVYRFQAEVFVEEKPGGNVTKK